MKYRAYRKDFFREIKNTYSRFLSILCIVALGVAFYTGIRSSGPDMKLSVDKLYDDCKIYDLKIYSANGFTEEDVDKIGNLEGVSVVSGAYSYDMIDDTEVLKSTVKITSTEKNINEMHLTEGRYPEKTGECIVDETFLEKKEYKIGDKIVLTSGNDSLPDEYILKCSEFEIVGVFNNPLYLKTDHGDTSIGNGKIDGFISIIPEDFSLASYTELNVTVGDTADELCYSKEYEDKVEKVADKIKNLSETYIVTDRSYMQSYSEFEMDAERIDKIGNIVPIIFYIVAALVSLTTMTRMVDEQRTLIGTYKALGYGKVMIAMKYILYAILATVLGSVIGACVGSFVLPGVIINAYKLLYPNLYDIVMPLNILHCFTAVILSMICVIGATVVSCYRSLKSNAAELMRPEAPKNGKNILLEQIPFIWKRMSFTWKSVFRNIARYKKRIFMTIFGICGCMSLLLIGFGIKDSIGSIVVSQYKDLHKYDSYAKFDSVYDTEGIKSINEYYELSNDIGSYINIYATTSQLSNGSKNISGYVYVTDDEEKFKEYISFGEGKNVLNLETDGVVITKKLSILLNLKVGDEIELSGANGEQEIRLKITGISKNYIFHYVYMNKETYEKYFESDFGYNQTLIIQKNDKDLSSWLLEGEHISSVTTTDSLKENFENMLDGLDIIILVIIISAGGLAFVVLYNLNNINICERVRELATLKVLGFYDKDVSTYVFRENMVLSVVGILTGYFAGNLLHEFVMDTVEVDMVMFGRNIDLLSYIYATLITIGFTLIINLTMHFKLKKIDMTTSLKSIE